MYWPAGYLPCTSVIDFGTNGTYPFITNVKHILEVISEHFYTEIHFIDISGTYFQESTVKHSNQNSI